MFPNLTSKWRFLCPDILAMQDHKTYLLVGQHCFLYFVGDSPHASGSKERIRG
jgi:hypothetical protein